MIKYLDAAKAVNANPEATQYDVALAIANLGDAVKDLVAVEKPGKPDKSALKDAIDKYSKYTQGKYTDESWKKFEDALNHARKVYENENATQGEVDAAISALNIAENGLTTGEGSGNGNGNNGNTGKPSKPGKPNKPVKTGDEAPVLPLTATVAGLGAAIALLFKKRK